MIMFIKDGLYRIFIYKINSQFDFCLFSAPQNYTYPSRAYPYVQSALPPDSHIEVDDRLGTLRNLANEYNVQQGAKQRFDIPRDNDDDDEIFV
jgi:hypothetical protein